MVDGFIRADILLMQQHQGTIVTRQVGNWFTMEMADNGDAHIATQNQVNLNEWQ